MNAALIKLGEEFYKKTGLRAVTGDMLHDPKVLAVIASKPSKVQVQIIGILLNMLRAHDKISRTDDLTQIFNRKGFMDRLETAISTINAEAGGMRHTQGAQVLMIDLGDFKKINDTYGHKAGDKALQIFAKALEGSVRKKDTVARLGGDEFAAILPFTNEKGGERVRSNLSRVLNGLSFYWDHGGMKVEITIRANIGHCIVRPGVTADKVMEEADLCMYEMKRLDKNSRMNRESAGMKAPAIG